ncbi:MAG: hypothetical protein HY716_05320 [Planctomycetes bacterium]|nr:hypothetical protein [Planctomycetota bacterium]
MVIVSYLENTLTSPLAPSAPKPAAKIGRGTLFDAAREALDRKSDPSTWRSDLMNRIRARLDGYRGELQSAHLRFASSVLDRVLDGSLEVRSEIPERPSDAVIVVHKAAGRDLGPDVLLVCESLEVEEMDGCVAVVLGDVRIRRLEDSFLFVAGKIDVQEDIRRSVIFAEGNVSARLIDRCFASTREGVQAEESRDSVYLDTPVRRFQRASGDREIR